MDLRRSNGVVGTAVAAGIVAASFAERVLRRDRSPAGRAADEGAPARTERADGTDATGDDGGGGGNLLDRALDAVDRAQRRFVVTAFAFGVAKKFTEDRAGQLGALVAYYSFFALLPLLLALVTVLRFVLSGNEELQERIVDSAIAQIPVIGDDVTRNVDAIQGSRLTLVAGLLGAMWAGVRAMTAAQNALDEIWDVPMVERPNFIFARLRGLALMGLIAAGLLGSIAVSNVAALVQGLPGGGRVALYAGSIALNVVVIGAAYLVLTDLPLRVRHIYPGALIGGVGYWLLQLAGSAIIVRVASGAQGADRSVAVVIALLTWFFLIAQVTIVAAEINVVWCRRLWPRSLTGRHLTNADVKAFTAYARQAKRSDVVAVHVVESARPGADLPDAEEAGPYGAGDRRPA